MRAYFCADVATEKKQQKNTNAQEITDVTEKKIFWQSQHMQSHVSDIESRAELEPSSTRLHRRAHAWGHVCKPVCMCMSVSVLDDYLWKIVTCV